MIAWLMGLRSITPAALLLHTQQGTVTVVDVNARASWLHGRVPGAISLDPVAFDAGELPTDKNRSLVFYCSNPMCRKAPNAARRARQMGWRNVRVMSAGISGWRAAQLPVESG